MIIYVEELADPKQLETLKEWLNGIGVEVHSLKGENGTILGLLGETQNVDIEMVQGLDFVKKVVIDDFVVKYYYKKVFIKEETETNEID